MKRPSILISVLIGSAMLAAWIEPARAADPPEWAYVGKGNFADHIERRLRYWPVDGDFVITNGTEFFNRPLYCLNSAFRIDAGDHPEFSLYLPGRGGNLRFGIKTASGVKWLNDAQTIIARYHPGSMLYQLRDPLLGAGELDLAVLPLDKMKGFVVRAGLSGAGSPVTLIFAFGGANGMQGRRGGDIGCESEPVSQFFQLRPAECKGNQFSVATNTFMLRGKPGALAGILPLDSKLQVADANKWNSLDQLLVPARNGVPAEPVVVGQTDLENGTPVYFAVEQLAAPDDSSTVSAVDLPGLYSAAVAHRDAIAGQVIVTTPDPFINAAASALCVAADGIWDRKLQSFMHGAVAWRMRLLGWRGPYSGDELGWHDRTAEHFAGFAAQQNIDPIPAEIPPADPDSNLARHENALHSNGDLIRSHYDMNLVAVDAFFRHLLWTGDMDYAHKYWPVIVRHLAWEQRLFRREYGPGEPLYDAYADIWASDNMQYEGGGVAYSSAYNYFENAMAARIAPSLGDDPAPYVREAGLIRQAMQKDLWQTNYGWFAEYKDYLGLQLAHPDAGLWSVYTPIDSQASTPLQSWQMTRYVDTQIAHIPIKGPGVPAGNYYTLPESNWMPYEWSLNNVVVAEAAHTSLAFWEANRPNDAFNLFKGYLLDGMFLGQCPGNLGMSSEFDMARGESQRDFGDAIGTTSRALVEGLFGVHPDALAGMLTISPGFPADWNDASIQHPDFDFTFHRDGLTETYTVITKFPKPMALRLQIPALRDGVASVTVNGQPANWLMLDGSVGVPRIEIQGVPGPHFDIGVTWKGDKPASLAPEMPASAGAALSAQFGDAKLVNVTDPQSTLSNLVLGAHSFQALASGTVGHRTVFAQLRQGDLAWWQPVMLDIQSPESEMPAPMDWNGKLPADATSDTVDLASFFNDRVTQIFKNDYQSPRAPFCTLAIPEQGIGGWADDKEQFNVDDSGLRSMAAAHDGKLSLPDGVPLATPGGADAKNIAFVSQWDNYPRALSLPLTGKARRIFLLMAGSSNPMQSGFDNGEVVVTYADGSTARLPLRNPENWWPIEQDYFIDDYAFHRPGPIPPRVDLATGQIRIMDMNDIKGRGRDVPGGAATVLTLPLDPGKELKSLTVRALANEVVIGLMSVTLER
ncbi:MAG TPA: DUF4450 domain-containing protein [Verrucomicrobiae bacterium]|jgi:hypothetical protein